MFKARKAYKVIGIVRSYLTYKEEAISVQSKRTVLINETNAGLSVVETSDSIFSIFEQKTYAKAL